METRNKTKSNIAALISVFFICVLLIGNTTIVADNLSGKFFPANSPVFPNFYPNDFLPWAALLFMSIGWIATDFTFRTTSNSANFANAIFLALAVNVLIFFAISIVGARFRNIAFNDTPKMVWAFYVSQLIHIGALSGLVGGLLAYITNLLSHFYEKR
jgi:hypothetical protein